ncbi:sulfotransferase [Nonomuraea sp. MG754425]|uniref:sulfotransferase family protein n=1 Tax=Nonomuraea sp. MG754425 TaxID=2570319 RepID=UPI001F344E13|nr:sulfotransferase family protein [Nonomuraea sp. MG754425]MCF6468342.1 sulfotransferase [Nonomuraea sp. MG754425]
MMRVIGTGYGRTGTTSLKAALVRLGLGPCLSAGDVFRNPRLIRPLLGAVEGRAANWEEILAGYQSIVCEPATPCWRQLVQRYPDAKVVHTVRDPEQWISSVRRTLMRRRRHIDTLYGRAAIQMSSMLGTDFAPLIKLFQLTLEGQALRSVNERRPEHAMEQFRAHTDEVVAAVPADRLLIYDIGDEWGPLCEFLGVPVPAEPFPLKSTTVEFPTSRGFGREAAALFLSRTR